MAVALATKDVAQAVSDSPVFQKSIKLLEKKIDDLHKKGLLEEGKYIINIDW